MPNSENSKSRTKSIAFVDYIPAELRLNKEWMIVYYAKNPVNNLMERQRQRPPMLSDRTERLKHAKKIVTEINLKLSEGWSPFLEESGKNFKSFESAVSDFLKFIKKQTSEEILRPDSLRSYNSNLNILQQFIKQKNKKITFAVQINRLFCVEYLDWIYLEKNSSPRTRNNHLAFLKLFCNWLLSRGVLKENPASVIMRLDVNPKKRAYIPIELRLKISEWLLKNDKKFYTVCQLTYFCFIRSTELSKLRVNMINFKKSSLYIPGDISKNTKTDIITIPEGLLHVLADHVKSAEPTDFLFSDNHFKAGKSQLKVRKIQSHWDLLKKALKLPSKYQFYGLKDTGITDLLLMGIPAIKVRDQARHHDIKITEMYTPRNMGCDESIRIAGLKF